MSDDELLELGKKVSSLYDIPVYIVKISQIDNLIDTHIHDDLRIVMELAIENDIWVRTWNNLKFVRANLRVSSKSFQENYNDYSGNKILATTVAIMKALIHIKENSND